MNKKILALVLALCLPLCGCASLLERSYSIVEPYTDRYWDSGVEDTLKAESYQDLVNSLLLLIEQRSDEVIIRYYPPEGKDAYVQAILAKHEVQNETILGSYLLESLSLSYTAGDGYCTLVYSMTYRANAQDLSSLMALSDSQSLVDLLRLAVREGHDSLTAQFITKMSREEITEAVNQLWRELYLDELEASGALNPPPTEEESEESTPDGESESDEGEPSDENEGEAGESGESGENAGSEPSGDSETDATTESSEADEAGETGETGEGSETGEDAETSGDGETDGGETTAPDEIIIEIPPCPWTIIFYPDTDAAEIVEIKLK